MDCRKICGTAYLHVYWQMQKMRFLRPVRKKGLPQGTLSKLVLPDISFWKEMFVVSLEDLDRAFGCSLAALLENYVNSNTNGHVFNKRIRDSITELGKNSWCM